MLLAGVLGLAGIKLLNVPFAGTIIVVVLSAGGVALLVWLARHSWIRFVRDRGATAARIALRSSGREADAFRDLRATGIRSRIPSAQAFVAR